MIASLTTGRTAWSHQRQLPPSKLEWYCMVGWPGPTRQ